MGSNESVPRAVRLERLGRVAAYLTCPVCGTSLELATHTLRCAAGHSFDVAKQGYVNLLGTARPANADTTAMVHARAEFLDSGHYGPIAAAVRAAQPQPANFVVEVGAGTGYYLHQVLAGRCGLGLATDVSVPALRHAAATGLPAVVCDTWRRIPLRDHCADVVLCVFAPRNALEFERVLGSGGAVIVVTPSSDHLAELRDRFGLLQIEEHKDVRLGREFGAVGLRESARQPVEYRIAANAAELRALIAMGPNAFHSHAIPAEPMAVTVSVVVHTFTRG